MNSISWYEYHHWQPDEDQGIDYQHQYSIIQLVIMHLNPAYLMMFIDLTRSFIQARKLMGFFIEQSLQICGVWSFYKAMSDKVERYPLVKCSRAVFFLNLELCFPQALIFDKCCLVPNNTEHLLNKELNI